MNLDASRWNNSNRRLIDLPPEVFFLIIERLLPEDAALLALTAKSLYDEPRLQVIWKPDSRRDPGRFALLIARHSPEWTFCCHCRRLHLFRDTPKITDDWMQWRVCRIAPASVWLHLNPWNYHIQFEDVYKVMTRHRWGQPYGDGLKSLAVHTDWQILALTNTLNDEVKAKPGKKTLNSPESTLTKLDVMAEIEHDCLKLRTIQRLWYPAQIWGTLLEEGVVCRPLTYCQHSDWNSGFSPVVFPEDLRFDNTSTEIRHYTKQYFDALGSKTTPGLHNHRRFGTIRRGHCAKCDTSYHTTIWFHGNSGIEVALKTVTDLGTCEHPNDHKWHRAGFDASVSRRRPLKGQGRIHFSMYSRYLRTYYMPNVTSEIGCESFKRVQTSTVREGEEARMDEHDLRMAIQNVMDQEAQSTTLVANPLAPKLTGPTVNETWYLKAARHILGKIDSFERKETHYLDCQSPIWVQGWRP